MVLPHSSLPSLLTCTSPTPKNTPLPAPPSPPYSLVPAQTKEYFYPCSSLPSLLTCTSPNQRILLSLLLPPLLTHLYQPKPKNGPLPAPPSPPYSLVPVGELHHDVEGGQHHQSMEEGVAVGDPILLVVHVAHLPLLVAIFSVCAKPTTCATRCALRRQGRDKEDTPIFTYWSVQSVHHTQHYRMLVQPHTCLTVDTPPPPPQAHNCTCTCVYHSQNCLHNILHKRGPRMVVPLTAGTPALSPQLPIPLSSSGHSSMGLQDP